MESSGKVRFDMTINLGHVLTFLGFLITIFVGWVNLDKRVVVLEEKTVSQKIVDAHQDALVQSNIRQIEAGLADIKSYILRLEKKVDDLK